MINNIFKYGYNFFQNNDNLVKIYSTINQNICTKNLIFKDFAQFLMMVMMMIVTDHPNQKHKLENTMRT